MLRLQTLDLDDWTTISARESSNTSISENNMKDINCYENNVDHIFRMLLQELHHDGSSFYAVTHRGGGSLPFDGTTGSISNFFAKIVNPSCYRSPLIYYLNIHYPFDVGRVILPLLET